MAVKENLWPQTIGKKALPQPVKMLREQGIALSESTNGKLYGEVLASETPLLDGRHSLKSKPFSASGLYPCYDFYVCISGKRYRYLLLTIELPLFDYPVTIYDTISETSETVNSEGKFKEKIRLIFNAPETQDLLGRMMAYGLQKEG